MKNIELKFLKNRNTRYEVREIRNLQRKNRKILSSEIKYSISNIRYESWKISLTQAQIQDSNSQIQILRNFVRQNKSKRISILVAKPSLFLVQFLFHSTSVLANISNNIYQPFPLIDFSCFKSSTIKESITSFRKKFYYQHSFLFAILAILLGV